MENERHLKKMEEGQDKVVGLLEKLANDMDIIRNDVSLITNLIRHNVGIPVREIEKQKEPKRRSEVI